MSFNSPAKHGRIERHIMRQRGAGVRTVCANFGFDFGPFSAPTSQDATPTRDLDDPPAKRRKTVLSSEIVAPESIVVKSLEVPKAKKAAKSRRKLDIADDDDGQSIPMADDSFVAGLGRRKTATTKSRAQKTPLAKNTAATRAKAKAMETPATSSKPDVETLEAQPETLTARKRRATSKVVEVLEEEVGSIDQKPRVTTASGKRGKSQNREQVIEQEIRRTTAVLSRPGEASEAHIRKAPKKRGTGRKRKNMDDDVVLEKTGNVPVDAEMDELAESGAVRPGKEAVVCKDVDSRKPRSRDPPKVKKKELTSTRSKKKSMESAPLIGPSPVPACDDAGDELASGRSRLPVPSRSTKATRTRRQPLAETNMNTTLQSASPKKQPQDLLKQSSLEEPNLKRPASAPSPTQPQVPSPTKPASKRSKVTVRRDAVDVTIHHSGPTTAMKSHTGDHSEINDPKQSLDQAPKTFTSAADQSRGAATASERRNNLKPPDMRDADADRVSSCETSNAPVVKEPKVCNIVQGEEVDRDADVDWLFAPQPQASAPQPKVVKSKRGSVVKGRKFKMPEIDLDDLLSNIAVFAQEKSKSGATASQDVRLFAGGEKKSRGGARKKAKR